MGYNLLAKYSTLPEVILLKLELMYQLAILKSRLACAVQLTGALDGNFKLSSSGSFGVNLKVCSLLHPQALWLQTTALSFAEVGITCCGETYNERVRETQRQL